MDFSYASAISASGMEVERTRLDVASINLANVHTSRVPGGGPFKPLQAISANAFSTTYSNLENLLFTLPQAYVQQSNAAPHLVYEPHHPDANEKGFVAYPAIDTVNEMVHLMTAVRAYEANVAALNAAKSMAVKALELGNIA